MKTKKCGGRRLKGCGEEKPISQFYLNSYDIPLSLCAKCHNSYNKERYRKVVLERKERYAKALEVLTEHFHVDLRPRGKVKV